MGESEDSLTERNRGLVEDGTLPGPLQFVQPGENRWWDSIWQEPDWRKTSNATVEVPVHSENILYCIRPFSADTWSRRYIEPLIRYTFALHLRRFSRTFPMMRPTLDLRIAFELPPGERKFIEQTVRNAWEAPVRTGKPVTLGDHVGEHLQRFGLASLLVILTVSIWGYAAFRLPSDLWMWHTLKWLAPPVFAICGGAAWLIRDFYFDGLGKRPHHLLGSAASACLLLLLGGLPMVTWANTFSTRGLIAYEGQLLNAINPRHSKIQPLTFKDRKGRSFRLKLTSQEYQFLKVGDPIRLCYHQGWLGIPFVRSRQPRPNCPNAVKTATQY